MGFSGAKIVHFPGHAFFQQQPVAAYDVAHVGVIAARFQVTHEHHRLAEAQLNLRDLAGERGSHEHFAAPRAVMVECPRPEAGNAVAAKVLMGQQVLRDLAHRVRRKRVQLMFLRHRQLRLGHESVFLARPHHQHPGKWRAPLADRFQQMNLADDVCLQRLGGRVPRRHHLTLAGEMENPVGPGHRQHFRHGSLIAQVRLH